MFAATRRTLFIHQMISCYHQSASRFFSVEMKRVVVNGPRELRELCKDRKDCIRGSKSLEKNDKSALGFCCKLRRAWNEAISYAILQHFYHCNKSALSATNY